MNVTQFSFSDLVSKLISEEVRQRIRRTSRKQLRYMLVDDKRRPSLTRTAEICSTRTTIVGSEDTKHATAGRGRVRMVTEETTIQM